jgi:peptide/nickel transport system ATP-binding protein
VTSAGAAAVELRDCFRLYPSGDGGVAALQGLSMTVDEGECCVVFGPSGSGKTTLLRLVAGYDRASAGSVTVLGTELGLLSSRRRAAWRSDALGYVVQHSSRALVPELTLRDLTALRLALDGEAPAARRREADALLERIGLADRAQARPGELSGGEQQRVAVAAALADRPRLVLADEPTGELDAGNAAAVYTLLAELATEAGSTVLIVSHDPASRAIADRVVWIRDGRVSEAAEAEGEEELVLARGGWLRLPEELLQRAGIAGRARAELKDGGILVGPLERPARGGDAAGTHPVAAPTAPPTREPVAELHAVTKRFDGTTALADLEASFPAGSVSAVTGPSGSGKTTLLHLVAGLEEPDGGEVVVLGRPLRGLDREQRAAIRRETVGFVGQDVGLVPFLTAQENVELGLALHQAEPAEGGMQAGDALAAVGLADAAGRRVEQLSAGQRERVAVARAVASRPRLLLVDEPTARLDQANARALAELFLELARTTGAAVVCATHDPLLIERADRELSLAR